ncbi:MAG: arginine deiminase [Actinomycetaceae bacterium]|nr:arginine deiminase [Actinomycetaceae bacterium]
MSLGVFSEVGPLRQVIVHRPGKEMERLTPSNMGELLFDDVLWLSQAQRDHDAFSAALTGEGVDVLWFDDLLETALAHAEARDHVISRVFTEEFYGITAAETLISYARELNARQLADFVIEGMTRNELEEAVGTVDSTLVHRLGGDDLVSPCLPNLYFTRDTSMWIHTGVSINAMQMRARRRETILYEAIYRWHPMFAEATFTEWSNGLADGHATVEGGDVLVVGEGVVIVGLSERTTPAGLERLARSLFTDETVTTIIGIMMPQVRAQMHLDTVMTMANENTFVKYQHLGMRETVTITRRADGGLAVAPAPADEMHDVIARAMGLSDVRFLTVPESGRDAERGQWNDACNLLAVRPNVVVAYDRNERANEFLEEAGIRVLTVPGGELGRGRGGPRCMSCPTDRAGL